MSHVQRVVVAGLLFLAAAPAWVDTGAAAPPGGPKRVLIIHSFGQHFQPFSPVAASFRTELALRSPDPIDFYEVSLETARFAEGDVDEPLADYVGLLHARQKMDLVVPVGSPALRFCARHREDLFLDIPILAAGTENRHFATLDLGANFTAVGFEADPVGFVEDMLRVLPETRTIGAVFGDSPVERYWAAELRRLFEVFAGRVEFVWLDQLTMAGLREKVSALPAHSAILFVFFNFDAAGVSYVQDAALQAVRAVAEAPIFGMFEGQMGAGIVGGRLIDSRRNGMEAARIAVRMLGGESGAEIPRLTVEPTVPTFDWREMQRWEITEPRLPPGSIVQFRQPGAWDAWRGRIIGLATVVVLQAILIAMLLSSRRRLRSTQTKLGEKQQSVLELQRDLSHAGRVSLLGQFTASLAHELGQPLGAVLRNAEAAELFLKRTPPDLDEVRAILGDVRKDGERAGAVIERLRAMVKRRDVDVQMLDWNSIVDEVMWITRGDALLRGITLVVDTPPDLPAIRGDRVHFQQVLLNLVANAMDAVDGADVLDKRVTVRARSNGNGFVECEVSDTGTGITPDWADSIFEPFATTKERGMGMGLPISRTIVEAHGGVLWVESNPGRGATFRFTIPVFETRESHA